MATIENSSSVCANSNDSGAPIRKNCLLLFSKVPEPGLVKTRLTTLKDGMFDIETASELYKAMLFDVVDVCMAAFDRLDVLSNSHKANIADEDMGISEKIPRFKDEYELVISTAPAQNVDKMVALFANESYSHPIRFIADEGDSFDAHYNDAFSKTWEAGADAILSMGADMPALTVSDVVYGFESLHELSDTDTPGIVIAPDQELGVSIIGWNKNTDFDHSGVFYNQSGLTVLPAYIRKAKAAGIPALYLPPVPDVDTMADLMHASTLVEALCYCEAYRKYPAPARTQKVLVDIGLDEIRIAPNNLIDPREHIDHT